MDYRSIHLRFDKVTEKSLITCGEYSILLIMQGAVNVNDCWRIGT
ncbi:hypothetical protein EVA_13773, partial [gut metagenome]